MHTDIDSIVDIVDTYKYAYIYIYSYIYIYKYIYLNILYYLYQGLVNVPFWVYWTSPEKWGHLMTHVYIHMFFCIAHDVAMDGGMAPQAKHLDMELFQRLLKQAVLKTGFHGFLGLNW